jgi:hypothetical protein
MLSGRLDASLARKDCGLLFDGRPCQTLKVKAMLEIVGDYADIEKVRDVGIGPVASMGLLFLFGLPSAFKLLEFITASPGSPRIKVLQPLRRRFHAANAEKYEL